MGTARTLLFGTLVALCGVAAAFFAYFGVQIVYATLTFTGEGSLGHVGMLIAAGVYPLLAFFFGGCTFLAWRKLRQRPDGPPPS